MNFQIPTVAESGQHSFSSSLEKKGIFSDCGPKIDDGDGGDMQNDGQRKNNQNIEHYPAEARRSQDFNRHDRGEVIQELYINHH